MSILVEFLRILLRIAPDVFNSVKQGLDEMVTNGNISEERKEKLIQEISPAKDKEIDSEIDKQVEARFPKDKKEDTNE